jgi:hypothetical protein
MQYRATHLDNILRGFGWFVQWRFPLGLARARYAGFDWTFCERHLERQLDFIIVSFDGIHRCAERVTDYIVLAQIELDRGFGQASFQLRVEANGHGACLCGLHTHFYGD